MPRYRSCLMVARSSSAYTGKVYSPYGAGLSNVYFGDTHLHTDISMDAGAGNRLGLDPAHKLAPRAVHHAGLK